MMCGARRRASHEKEQDGRDTKYRRQVGAGGMIRLPCFYTAAFVLRVLNMKGGWVMFGFMGYDVWSSWKGLVVCLGLFCSL